VLYFSSDPTGISGVYAASVALSREDTGQEEKPKPDAKPEVKPEEPKPEEPKAEEPKKEDQPEGEARTDEPKPAAGEKKPAVKKPDWGKRWAESVTFKVEPVLVSDKEQRKPLPLARRQAPDHHPRPGRSHPLQRR
jgi:hypothetical protein